MPIYFKQSYVLFFTTIFFFAGIFFFNTPVYAEETRYVSDKLFVPLRTGQGDKYRIVHKGLPSGTAVTLLETDEESGYSLVETNKGVQGWMRSQYLLSTPTAALKLKATEEKLASFNTTESGLIKKTNSLTKELNTLQAQHKTLTKNHDKLKKQHNDLKALSANVIKVNDKNKELLEKNQMLQSQVDGLEATKEKLTDNTNIRMFVFGGLLVLATLVINTAIDGIKRRRSFSNWG